MDCAASWRPFSGSLPRVARSTTATCASSARRSFDMPASGVSVASCSGVARGSGGALVLASTGASELEHQVVLQHARAEAAGAFLDLQHGRLDLARLEVRDVDLRAALELGELLGEGLRAEVARDLGQLLLLVGEGGLDDQD